METSNLPDAEFKTLFIRMLNEHRARVDELSKNFNKVIGKEIGNIKMEIENIKKNSSEMKTTIIKIKNILEGNKIRLDEAIWKTK